MDEGNQAIFEILEFQRLMEKGRLLRKNVDFFFQNQHQGQGAIVALLNVHGQLTQKEIAEKLDITPQSASELIYKLEKANFIYREKSSNDGRMYILKLTDRGHDIANKAEHHRAFINDILNDSELKQFNMLFKKLNAGLIGRLNENKAGIK
ncbi:MarR family transcriptional regulator [Oenococcus sp. UCMA 16435]|nr:MarR family transcriptional regulator [Oenococcus sp. UCMA 16435]MDI4584617.1 MarR family transcriptional regulator [Oenococcus sp. UCMA 14587]